MAYSKQTWTNDVSPLNASRMTHIEDGIFDSMPAAAILPYAGAAAPTGWLLCDGASLLRADYADLFAALGGASSPWGLPDGTHFNVPDLRGRMPVGKGTNTDVDTLAEDEGSTVGDRRPKHKHTVNDAGHIHNIGAGSSGTPNEGYMSALSQAITNQTEVTANATTGVTIGPQTVSPTDAPAYVVVNYIIKT